MGFDNECILNIQSLGDYFCPVCRTLVYPNEALQTQCTHLYCKPCLAYVVRCPYDGCLVTEAGAKPLVENNKHLAETIGEIAVRCLYHRAGCTWQGPLSECTAHCSGCAFRRGTQILTTPGANHQPQQGPDNVQAAATTGTAMSIDQNKSGTQTGAPAFATQASHTAAGSSVTQKLNLPLPTNAQAQPLPASALPTPGLWSQKLVTSQYLQAYQQQLVTQQRRLAQSHSQAHQLQSQHQLQQQFLHLTQQRRLAQSHSQAHQLQSQHQLQQQFLHLTQQYRQAQSHSQAHQLQSQHQLQHQLRHLTHVQLQVQAHPQPQAQPQSHHPTQGQGQPQTQLQPQAQRQSLGDNMTLDDLESKYNEITGSLSSFLKNEDDLVHAHASEIKKVAAQFKEFLEEYKQKRAQLDAESKILHQREEELKKKEAQNLKLREKLEFRKTTNEQLTRCKELLNECSSSRKEEGDLKREVEKLHDRINEMQRRLRRQRVSRLCRRLRIWKPL